MKTPAALQPLIDDGVIDEVIRSLKSGKEATVYLVRSGAHTRCAKVYRHMRQRSFQKRARYQEGRKVRGSRQARAIAKSTRFGRKEQEAAWKNAEVDALYKLAAAGVRVPKPYGDYLVLDILKRSGGTAVAVSDPEIRDAAREWGSIEGIFAAPEGAASLAAYRKLRQPQRGKSSFLSAEDNVVLFNTGTGLKYLDVVEEKKSPASRHIGGIIGPY